MTAFAVAVESYREALARFDAPPGLYANADPRWPEDQDVGVWIDWCDIREVTVPAEEAELEARFGRGTRSAGGGGELRGRRIVNRDRPSVNREPVRANRAAEGPREVVEMPKGVKLETVAVLGALDTVGRTAQSIAAKLGVGEGPVSKRLRALAADGRAKQVGGGRGIGPTVWAAGPTWAAVSTRKADPKPAEREAERKGKREADQRLLDAERKAAAEALAAGQIDGCVYGPPPVFNGTMELEGEDGQRFVGHLGGLHDRIAAEIDREVKHRTVLALREAADRLEGELKRGAA